jgi:hypothetical protein
MLALMPVANFFIWFAGTKVGRIVGLVALVLGAVFALWLKAKSVGRAEEREKQRKETDDFIADRKKIDADVADDSDSALDKRVRPWVTPGTK